MPESEPDGDEDMLSLGSSPAEQASDEGGASGADDGVPAAQASDENFSLATVTDFLEEAESAHANLSAWLLLANAWIMKLAGNKCVTELREEISHFTTELAIHISALEMNIKDEDMAEVTSWERKLLELDASMRTLETKYVDFKVIMEPFMEAETVDTSSDMDDAVES